MPDVEQPDRPHDAERRDRIPEPAETDEPAGEKHARDNRDNENPA